MDLEKVRDRVRQLIIEKIPLAGKQKIGDGDLLLESGVLDSLGVLDVVNVIEENFQITLTDDELVPENFQTIGHIASFVANKVNLK